MSEREKRAVEMRKHLVRWEKSGKSLKAFASQEGIPYTTLSYWRRRESEGSPRPKRRRSAGSKPPLVPVRVVGGPSRPSEAGFEVRLANGAEVRVRSGFDAGELGAVLQAARSC